MLLVYGSDFNVPLTKTVNEPVSFIRFNIDTYADLEEVGGVSNDGTLDMISTSGFF